jgi:predicted NBD/HSP70 family sugar kinase
LPSAETSFRVDVPADQHSVRRANLGLVLRTLRSGGGRTRAALADELGLTRTAASSLVGELETRGLVRSGARVQGSTGRPGTVVELNGSRVCGVGAEVNVHHVAVMAVDLAGAAVAERRLGLDVARLSPDQVADEVARLLVELLADLADHGTTVVGVTVAVAGLVDAQAQRVTVAPNLGWRETDLAARIRSRLGSEAPEVLVDNEANLAALAEVDGSDPDRSDMVVLFGEVGLGGGLIVDGRLRRGRHGYAGELGHIIVDPQGRPCGCGRVGCWETVTGLRALLDQATDPDDPVRDPALRLEDRIGVLVERARNGDDRTLAALHQVGSWLGAGAAVLVNALDPGVIVLGGYFAMVAEWLVGPVEQQLGAGVLAPRPGGTRVAVSTLGPLAAARGAALTSLDPVFTDPTGVPATAPVPGAGESA